MVHPFFSNSGTGDEACTALVAPVDVGGRRARTFALRLIADPIFAARLVRIQDLAVLVVHCAIVFDLSYCTSGTAAASGVLFSGSPSALFNPSSDDNRLLCFE